MAQTSPDADDIIADSMTVSGADVTFTGLDTDDDDDDDENDNSLPDSWVEGAMVEIKAPPTTRYQRRPDTALSQARC
jgi:hypothetical protein